MKNHDVEEMSTRELERLIKEKEELQRSFEAEKQRNAVLAESLHAAQDDAKALKKEGNDVRRKLEEQLQAAKKKEAEALAEAERATQELKKQTEKPNVSAEELDKIKKEVLSEAQKDFGEKARAERDRIAKLEETIKRAEADAARAAAGAEKLRKQLAMANADATMFKVHFEALQEGFNKLHGVYMKIEAAEPEQALRFRNAMCAVVESFRKRLEG